MTDGFVFTSLGIVIGLSIQWLYRECRRHMARYRIVKQRAPTCYSGYEPISMSHEDRLGASEYKSFEDQVREIYGDRPTDILRGSSS